MPQPHVEDTGALGEPGEGGQFAGGALLGPVAGDVGAVEVPVAVVDVFAPQLLVQVDELVVVLAYGVVKFLHGTGER